MRTRLAPILLLLLVGCASPQTVSRAELERLKARWQEPKVSTWYYVGSKDGYHYFHHYDLGRNSKHFRISSAELSWPDPFPLTQRRSDWRRLDWGVHERR